MNMIFLHIRYAKLLVYKLFTQNALQNQEMLRIFYQVWMQISRILLIVFCALFCFVPSLIINSTKISGIDTVVLCNYIILNSF